MSSADVQATPTPALPDYLLNPNAVLNDASEWRYGKAPDYSKTRTVFEQTKKYSHEASSLPSLVENLVKNWEIEASFKPQLSDWRTVDRPNYSFAINGGPPQTAEHMLKVGTYNAIIAPNEFYSPAASDFASSHKTFKRMMPTFAWEVMEVYSGPPRVAFRWRHWGEMKNDYVGFNDKGERITAKAHNGPIDIEGVTVAQVDDQVRLQKVETWFDPLEMFRQIAPNGIVNKEVREPHDVGEDKDQREHRAAQTAEGNVEPQIAEISTSTAQSSIRIPQSQKNQSKEEAENTSGDPEAPVEEHNEVAMTKTDKLPAQINASSTAPSYSNDLLAASTSTQSKDREQLTPGSTRVPTPDSDSKPQTKDLENGDNAEVKEAKPRAVIKEVPQVPTPAADSHATGIEPVPKAETGIAEPQFPSNNLTNQILKTLESVQSSLGQLSARADDFEARISKLEGVSSNSTGTAPLSGNAIAAAPESEETRQTHEEMSNISAGECPFLMNRE